MKRFPRNKTKKIRSLWNLRYRFYALLIIIIISPMAFYSGDKNIPETVTNLNQKVVYSNLLASKIQRVNSQDQNNFTTAGTSAGTNNTNENSSNGVVEDVVGQVITEQLRKIRIDAGFISSKPFIELGSPIKISEEDKSIIQNDSDTSSHTVSQQNKPLDKIIPPERASSTLRNVLLYDKYKIRAPIIYTTFEDLFEKREDGTFNFSRPLDADSIDSPVQRKLERGIVHLAYTPQPGELGNSYIVGHSSNYSWVNSPFNRVFAPIEEQSQPGETFVIFDRHGRELKFRVFETLKIRAGESDIAFKPFPDRRVVTLQTSVLGMENGRLAATHRWLTRGELVVD